jgi:hypothetical protein
LSRRIIHWMILWKTNFPIRESNRKYSHHFTGDRFADCREFSSIRS